MTRRLIVRGLLLSIVSVALLLSGCGDKASKDLFGSLLDKAVSADNTSALAHKVTLPLVVLRGNKVTLPLVVRRGNTVVMAGRFNYAVMQQLVSADVLAAGQHQDYWITYKIIAPERAKKIFGQNGRMVTVALGTFQPKSITNFTVPSDDVTNPDSTATVDFELKLADWLDSESIQTIREAFGVVYADRFDGPNPVSMDMQELNRLSRKVGSNYFINDRKKRDNQAKQGMINQWRMLAIDGTTANITFHQTDEGWVLADPIDTWLDKTLKVSSIKPFTAEDLQQARTTIGERLNPNAEKPGDDPVPEDTIREVVSSGGAAMPGLSVVSPFGGPSGTGPVVCTTETERSAWTGEISVEDSCDRNKTHKLNRLVSHGLATRVVVDTGKVTYSPTDKARSLIDNGLMRAGTQHILQIVSQQSGMTWFGQPKAIVVVKAEKELYDWAVENAFGLRAVPDGTTQHITLTMIGDGEGNWEETGRRVSTFLQ